MAYKKMTYDILKINKYIQVNDIRVGKDQNLYLTPQKKLEIITEKAVLNIQKRYLLFTPHIDNVGFGVLIDNDSIQLGYGTREQFETHSIENGITFDTTGPSIPAVEVESIPIETIDDMFP